MIDLCFSKHKLLILFMHNIEVNAQLLTYEHDNATNLILLIY